MTNQYTLLWESSLFIRNFQVISEISAYQLDFIFWAKLHLFTFQKYSKA